ncbi:GNAT family N-acetyltransferase [Cribrihabitans neustonicus]|uniref:GNAT family N-acetyltransferase n=1 Tax=Cribrihabitans neustonicus TaxID=1429085 RepID=UPI003B5BFE24
MIRPYTPSDEERVLHIWRSASAQAHPFLSAEQTAQAETMIRETFLPMAETWLACPGGTPAGFIALIGEEAGGLFVLPGFQGLGLGRALLDHALTRRSRLELDVFTENQRALQFYCHYGFAKVEERMNALFGHSEIRMRYDPAGKS